MAIQSWFPTSIYYEPLEKRGLEKFNRELAHECYAIREMDEQGQQWSKKNYVGGYTSHGSIPELHRMSSTFMALEKKFNRHVRDFAVHLGFDLGQGSLSMCDCWVNIMPSQTSHGMHIHPLSVISGTYYVQTPKNSASIKFEDPRLDKFMARPPIVSSTSKRKQMIAEYKAQAGHIVLFESWLRHEVPASVTTEERISISFNFDWV